MCSSGGCLTREREDRNGQIDTRAMQQRAYLRTDKEEEKRRLQEKKRNELNRGGRASFGGQEHRL